MWFVHTDTAVRVLYVICTYRHSGKGTIVYVICTYRHRGKGTICDLYIPVCSGD